MERQAPPKAKVCIVTTAHAPSDTRIFHRQAKTLAGAGYDVVLLAARQEKPSEDSGIRVVELPPWSNRLKRMTLHVGQALLLAYRERADLYHLHDPELLIAGLILQTLTKRPVIYDVHEDYPKFILSKAWIPPFLRRPFSRLMSTVEPALARRLSAVIIAGDTLKERFETVNPRTITVHNFPRIKPLGRPEAPLVTGTKGFSGTIIYAGSITEDRGYETMLRTAAILRERKVPARILLLGRIRLASAHPSLERLGEELEQAGVLVRDYVPYDQVHSYLTNSEIGWIPWKITPLHLLGMPNKLFEYMMAGLCVVASDFGLISQIIRDNDCGMLVPPGDAEANAEAICYLLHHPEERERMGQNGRNAALSRYNWASEADRLLRLYADLVGQVAEREIT